MLKNRSRRNSRENLNNLHSNLKDSIKSSYYEIYKSFPLDIFISLKGRVNWWFIIVLFLAKPLASKAIVPPHVLLHILEFKVIKIKITNVFLFLLPDLILFVNGNDEILVTNPA